MLERYGSLEIVKAQPLKQRRGMQGLHPALAHVLTTPHSEQTASIFMNKSILIKINFVILFMLQKKMGKDRIKL